MTHGLGDPKKPLSDDAVRRTVADFLKGDEIFRGKKVLALVPDETRSCPLPLLFESLVEELRGKTARLSFLVAIGTHAVPPEEELLRPFGLDPETKKRACWAILIVTALVAPRTPTRPSWAGFR